MNLSTVSWFSLIKTWKYGGGGVRENFAREKSSRIFGAYDEGQDSKYEGKRKHCMIA